MAESQQSKNKKKRPMGWKKTLIISLLVLAIGVVAVVVIFQTEPKAKRGGATKETAMLVDVLTINRGNYRPTITTTGTVVPSKDIVLSPRVSGQVITLSTGFTPGGFVSKNDILLRIDPSDYQNALQLRISELQQAEAELSIEMGRQNVARKDYQLLEEEFAGEDSSLVLREPQLNAARSRVEAARAAVEQARLDLRRTVIRAPFDAHILGRNVNVGSQVAPGENLGRLVGRDVYWIEATLPVATLRWLSFPDSELGKGSPVRITNRSAWEQGEFREGYVYKLIGALEGNTRLAKVLVAVEDPLLQQSTSSELQPLIIGAFMEVGIEAGEIQDVFRIDRDLIRKNETVWVMVDNKLQIREVDIPFMNADYAYVSSGLNENEEVVVTNLTTVAEGVNLRVESSDAGENQVESQSSGGNE